MSGEVLVVGGGIAGLALVRALDARGVPCDLVERAPDPPSPGLGLNLPGNALRALGVLGLADAVISRGAGSGDGSTAPEPAGCCSRWTNRDFGDRMPPRCAFAAAT